MYAGNSTSITSTWHYSNYESLNFDKTWHAVKEVIMETFGGDVVAGIPSPSVQNTIFLAQKNVLEKIKEVREFDAQFSAIDFL